MNIYAVIVGIEHYETLTDGLNIELDGPASDAIRFASLLLERGVPPDHVHLFVSCLNTAARRAEMDLAPGGSAVRFEKATRDEIERCFDTVLPMIPGPATLYVLWGGHGAMRAGHERFLFYSNMRKKSPIAFHLNQRLAQLRTFANLTTQHIFVDACANYVEFSSLEKIFFTEADSGDPDPCVTQDAVLAAASGQKARNDRVERTGTFSRELFALMAQTPDRWPSAAELAPELEQVFLKKGREDRGFRQRPVSLHFRRNDGSESILGTLPKPEKLLYLAEVAKCSIGQLDFLVRFLEESEVLRDATGRDTIFEQLFGMSKADRPFRNDAQLDCAALAAWTLHRGWIRDLTRLLDSKGDSAFGAIETALKRVDLARQVLRLLDSMKLPSEIYLQALRGLPHIKTDNTYFEDLITDLSTKGTLAENPLYRFLLELSTLVEPLHRAKIDCFLDEAGANASYISAIKQQLLRSLKYRLIVSVKHTPLSVWGLLLENGIAHSPRAIRSFSDDSSFIAGVQEIYCELLSELTGDISVELVLPFEQLCFEVEGVGIATELPFALSATPLGHRYPVVLRWRERLLKPGTYQGERWLRASKLIAQRTSSDDWVARMGSVPDGADEAFWATLEYPEHDLLDLGSQPESTMATNLFKSLYYGTSYACWLRGLHFSSNSQAVYESGLSTQLTGGPFGDFPRRVVEMRKNANGLSPIALLWDDPDTNPVTYIRTFEEIK